MASPGLLRISISTRDVPKIVGSNSATETIAKNDILQKSLELVIITRLANDRRQADQGLSTERGTAR